MKQLLLLALTLVLLTVGNVLLVELTVAPLAWSLSPAEPELMARFPLDDAAATQRLGMSNLAAGTMASGHPLDAQARYGGGVIPSVEGLPAHPDVLVEGLSTNARALLPVVAQDFVPPLPAHLGYGANIASADHAVSLTVMGFDWAKGFVTWSNAGTGPIYDWVAVDNQLREFVPEVRHVLLLLNGPPPTGIGSPPVSADDQAAFHNFALALARHISDTWRTRGLETAAYEIWNEPNLDYEWGGRPDAGQYTRLLQAGYRGIKAGDPQAIVISAGLATTGGSVTELALAQRLYGADQVIPDLTFLRGMYRHEAKGYFDALGSHPYGGPDAPATAPGESTGPIYFRRAEEQHQVMLSFGDQSPVWATEFGWVLETECHLGEHEWMEVGEPQQAEYLTAAYRYADENWPWMGPMFIFNLDCGSVYWYAECDPVRWYSITYREHPHNPAHSPLLPRQAFDRLSELVKRSAW